ncbi:MAG: hypothetical protein H7841_16665 [Magnetospirillum sp. WYHS-4]
MMRAPIRAPDPRCEMTADGTQLRHLRELELENARLRRAVVELTLDNATLREALRSVSPSFGTM